jgi:very-short-patch-repair endonuclease
MPRDGRNSFDKRRNLGQRGEWAARERAVITLGRRQHDVVEVSQLRALGFDSAAVHRRVATGRLFPKHQGVYAVGRPDLSVRGRWMAAVLACGEGAALSHRAASALHDLLTWSGGAVDVTVPDRSGRSMSGIRIHRPTSLLPADLTEVDGIPCTSVARTLLDIAATQPQLLERACHRAEIVGALDLGAVMDLLKRLHRQPGTRRLRRVLQLADLGTDRTRSELERRFHRLAEEAGLPLPAVNEWLAIGGEEWQFDFVWHRQKVIVEVDGWQTHGTRFAFEHDRRRDRLLRMHGWEPLRFTWRDVTEDPPHVEEVTRAVLRDRAGRRWPK